MLHEADPSAPTPFLSRQATGPEFELAEGILWDDRRHEVVWVEITEGDLHVAGFDGTDLTARRVLPFGPTVGAVALTEDGGYLLAGSRGLVTLSPDGVLRRGPDLLGERQDVRLNDGTVDPQGRFLVGTLSLTGPTGLEELLRISPDGTVETVRTGLSLSNGVAFSPDGATVYHVDTLRHSLESHSYGPGAFDHDEPWVPVRAAFAGHPDGLVVDAEGLLWVAQWGASRVQRFAADGVLVAEVSVDAPQVSCMAFIGPERDTLAITTAREGLASPPAASGALFLADVGTTGLPEHRWAGSTRAPSWAT
ncbi:MAG TPA: SMP-30/gluconolactonase/LRE family protein [Cellulomonadaceae bacterium]|nr:SMP-30/gluconolactonase/LRE family protein [Cellulomonadaceae bacterium]